MSRPSLNPQHIHTKPTTLSRTSQLLEEHGKTVMYREDNLALVLGAKLSLDGNNDLPSTPMYTTTQKNTSFESRSSRTASRRNSDGLALARLQFKFVIDHNILFCYSNATITPKGSTRGSLGGDGPSSNVPLLLDTFPLSVCHLTIESSASTSTIPGLSLSSFHSKVWLLTLYFKNVTSYSLWKETLIKLTGSYSDLDANANTNTTTNTTINTTITNAKSTKVTFSASSPLIKENKSIRKHLTRKSSYETWVATSPQPVRSSQSPEDVRQSIQTLETKSKQLRHSTYSKTASFVSQLEAQTHLFGCEVGWRALKLLDDTSTRNR